MKKNLYFRTFLIALTFLLLVSLPTVAQTPEQTEQASNSNLQELVARLEQANGRLPADFTLEDMNTFLEHADPDTVNRIMEKIIDNAPPVPMPEVNPNVEQDAQRSNEYRSYNFTTKLEQKLSYDNF